MTYQTKTNKEMKRFYYVVTKQLDEIGGVYESNGWKSVSVYKIENDIPTLIEELDIEIGENSELEIKDFLIEKEMIKENEEINLTQL